MSKIIIKKRTPEEREEAITEIIATCVSYKYKNEQLKEVIDKANNELITLIQIIGEQPSKNVEEDNYLLSRLESISNILNGGIDE